MATYSRRWREVFGEPDPAVTAAEVAFLVHLLPLPAFAVVLDVACGTGRHMRALARAGYRVIGVDSDAGAVAEANAAGVDVRVGDMRGLEMLPSAFDAVICMWASFGYFDADTNEGVVAQFAARLRREGRLVLDVYNRAFFDAHQGERVNRGVREATLVRDGRLQTLLEYADGSRDAFEWQLFTPDELVELCRRRGLEPVASCTEFDLARPPSADRPRMQLAFTRR